MTDEGNPSRREESDEQRLNRELDQLLNELRVAMPGVQVLFGSRTVTVTIAATAALFVGLWFGLGLVRRVAGERSH